MKYQCIRCGYNDTVRYFYACKAPLCDITGLVICSDCERALRNEYKSSFGKCHKCKVGLIENLGFNKR